MTDILSGLLKLLISLIPIFGGFLYYVGRRYTESYYETLGIPTEALNFSTADYLFKSIQSWVFLIAVALTSLILILWRVMVKKPEVEIAVTTTVARRKRLVKKIAETIKQSINVLIKCFTIRKGDPQLLMIGFFFYFILGLILIGIWIYPTARPNFAAEAFTELIMLMSLFVLAMIILTDKPTMQYILSKRNLLNIFVVGVIFTTVVSAQLLPHGLGRLVGIYELVPMRAEMVFPEVKIYSKEILGPPELRWNINNGIYGTEGRLILILNNNEGLFLRELKEQKISKIIEVKQISETFFIPSRDIIGMNISMPGRYPKIEFDSDNRTKE